MSLSDYTNTQLINEVLLRCKNTEGILAQCSCCGTEMDDVEDFPLAHLRICCGVIGCIHRSEKIPLPKRGIR